MADGIEIGASRVTQSPYNYTLDTTTLANGQHTLQIWAHDISNSVHLSATVPVTVANGNTTSPVTPTFSPAGGTYTSAQTVTISTTTPSATIYYTTNGATPTTSSPIYSGPITVAANETVEAIAVVKGGSASTTGSAAYTITPLAATPTFSPAGGTYTSAQTVNLSASHWSTIYYTTNGSTPTTSSAVYTGSITVSSTETINAVAVTSRSEEHT